MNIRPLGGHIIVEAKVKESKTASGIFLPENEEKQPEQGRVIAVGPGRFLENGTRQVMEVKVGDTIVFKKYGPDEVEVEGKKFLVVAADDIMAVIE